jgi:hypothetical protein
MRGDLRRVFLASLAPTYALDVDDVAVRIGSRTTAPACLKADPRDRELLEVPAIREIEARVMN